jgi:hypothetical protein
VSWFFRSSRPRRKPRSKDRCPRLTAERLERRDLLTASFGFAYGIGGSSFDTTAATTTDSSGNVYVTGYYGSTATVNAASGSATLSSTGEDDTFVAKYSETGVLDWAVSLGGTGNTHGFGISVDSSGNVYSTGSFEGRVNFNPGGTFNLTAQGSQDAYVVKLTSSGSFGWAIDLGGSSGSATGLSLAASADGTSVYVGGTFQGTVNFEPGGTGGSETSTDTGDAFVAKYSASTGAADWADATVGSTSAGGADVTALTVDSNGNVYTTGYFEATENFSGNNETDYLNSSGGQNVFVWKLKADGTYIWSTSFAGSGSATTDQAHGIAVDSSGNVYTDGYYQNTMTIGAQGNSTTLTSNGGSDIFVDKLNSSDSFVWARSVGGPSTDQAFGLTLSGGDLYAAGSFLGTVDFDPSGSLFTLTSKGTQDGFVLEMDTTGAFVMADQVGGSGSSVYINGVAVAPDGTIDTGGNFTSSADFDPYSGVSTLTSAGQSDGFVAHFVPDTAPTTTGLSAVSVLENAAPSTVTLSSAFTGTFDPGTALTYSIASDSNSALFSAATVNNTSDTLTLSFAPNTSGTANLVVEATDSVGKTVTTTLAVTVGFVNQAPTFTVGTNISVPENAGAQSFATWATNISPGAGNPGTESVNFIIVSNSSTTLFSVQPIVSSTGTLSFTPATGVNGSATISLELHNNGGTANGGHDTSAPQTFTISIGSGGPTTLVINGTSGGDNVSVSFTSATTFTTTVSNSQTGSPGVTNTYSLSNVNKVQFVGVNGGAESIIFDDPYNTYNASMGLGTATATTSGFEFDASAATTLYLYCTSASQATVTTPSNQNAFFVGVAKGNYDYLYGGGVYSEVSGFGSITATGAGGSTYAYLYSTSGAKIDAVPKGTSTLTAGSLTVTASDFPQIYSVGASDGTDTITLHSGGNRFVGTPTFSYVTDSTFSSTTFTYLFGALYAATVDVVASSTTDSAYFDSYSGNAFSGSPTLSELSGSDAFFSKFTISASGFDSATVAASGSGTDTATLNSPGNGTFVGTTTYATLTAGAMTVEASGYTQITTTGAHNGTDVAYLYDASGSNTLTAQGSTAVMTTPVYTDTVDDYGTVYGEQQNGSSDVVQRLAAIDFNLQTVGNWTNG